LRRVFLSLLATLLAVLSGLLLVALSLLGGLLGDALRNQGTRQPRSRHAHVIDAP
jgi:hypothetical protein